MTTPTPALLSHYTTAAVFVDHIAAERRLRLSPLAFANDPAESFSWEFRESFSTSPGERDRYPSRKAKKFRKLSKNYIQQSIKISCFCKPARPDDIWLKPRMWATYGDRNRGVNLVFDQALLLERVAATFRGKKFWHGDVRYTQISIPSLDFEALTARAVDLNRLSRVRPRDLLLEMVEKHARRYFFEKHEDWRDENEYRIAVLDEESEFAYLPLEKEIFAVVLGAGFDRRLIPSIITARGRFANPPDVFLVTHLSDGTYYLVPAAFYSEGKIAEDLILPTEHESMAHILRSWI